MLTQLEMLRNKRKWPAKLNKQWLAMTLCGLFVSATTIIDWYLNETNNLLPFSEEEYLRHPYLCLILKPVQVIATPDLTTFWWMVVLVAGWMFLLGYISAKVVFIFYKRRLIATQNVYLKIIAAVGLIIGLSSGYFLLIGAYMLPLVWKIYLSIVTAMLTFTGTYFVFRSPYRLYLWWISEKVLFLRTQSAKVFTELGYGNSSLVSTEIELPDGRAYRQSSFVRMRVEGVYLRVWVGTSGVILSSKNGLKFLRKARNEFKILVGIHGQSESPETMKFITPQ